MADHIATRKSTFTSASASRKRRTHQPSVRTFGRRVDVYSKPEKYGLMAKQKQAEEWIQYIHARYHEDDISISQIARELNTCGVPTKRNGTWSHKQVSRIVLRNT